MLIGSGGPFEGFDFEAEKRPDFIERRKRFMQRIEQVEAAQERLQQVFQPGDVEFNIDYESKSDLIVLTVFHKERFVLALASELLIHPHCLAIVTLIKQYIHGNRPEESDNKEQNASGGISKECPFSAADILAMADYLSQYFKEHGTFPVMSPEMFDVLPGETRRD